MVVWSRNGEKHNRQEATIFSFFFIQHQAERVFFGFRCRDQVVVCRSWSCEDEKPNWMQADWENNAVILAIHWGNMSLWTRCGGRRESNGTDIRLRCKTTVVQRSCYSLIDIYGSWPSYVAHGIFYKSCCCFHSNMRTIPNLVFVHRLILTIIQCSIPYVYTCVCVCIYSYTNAYVCVYICI